jgi:RND family efflux transporter MFP subunit
MKTSRSVALLLAAAVPLTGCGGSAETATEKPRGVPVRTAPVERRDLDDLLVLTGTLRPRAQVQVVAEISARLLKVVKDEGAPVAEGETLAVLDDIDYRLAHERARAALAVAEAGKAHAIVEKERADNLLKTGGITDKDHLAAQVSLQVAEASLAQARAETAIAGQQHSRAQVKAPFAGRVAKRMADPGAMLTSGTPLFTLVDDSVLEFRAAVPSADYGKAQVGAPVDVTVDALPGFATKGRVARVTPLVEERTRSFEVVVQVPGAKNLIGGLFARAAVRVRRVPGALVVPPSALLRSDAAPGEAEVFVVAAGKADKRVVGLGLETAEAVQVTKGLEAGDAVVLDPPVGLGAGTAVEIQNARSK